MNSLGQLQSQEFSHLGLHEIPRPSFQKRQVCSTRDSGVLGRSYFNFLHLYQEVIHLKGLRSRRHKWYILFLKAFGHQLMFSNFSQRLGFLGSRNQSSTPTATRPFSGWSTWPTSWVRWHHFLHYHGNWQILLHRCCAACLGHLVWAGGRSVRRALKFFCSQK